MDHLDTQSDAQSHISLQNEGDASEQQLIQEKHRLETVITKLNMQLKDKNEKILDLLEHIEDINIAV